jgi:hypothetical protein
MNEQELLASLREEPIDEREYAEVRSRTIGRIRRERFVWFGAAAAAVLLMIGSSFAVRSKPVPEVAPVARVQPATPVVEEKLIAETRPVEPVRVRRPAPPVEPMTIHLMSDDPDIAIIWLVGDTL